MVLLNHSLANFLHLFTPWLNIFPHLPPPLSLSLCCVLWSCYHAGESDLVGLLFWQQERDGITSRECPSGVYVHMYRFVFFLLFCDNHSAISVFYFPVFLLSSSYWLKGFVCEPIRGAVSVILLRGPSIQLLVFCSSLFLFKHILWDMSSLNSLENWNQHSAALWMNERIF